MFKNYFKIATRTIAREKGYASINILGLVVGMAFFVSIGRYIQYEFSFDTFHENAERIHRIDQRQPGNTFLGSDLFAITPAPLARALLADFPEVESATSLESAAGLRLVDNQSVFEFGFYADEKLFDVFSFQVRISGPMLDRIDLHLDVRPISPEVLAGRKQESEPSIAIRERVLAAREIQLHRYGQMLGVTANADIRPGRLEYLVSPTEKARSLLRMALRKLDLTPRGYHRVLRVARTIADLEGERIERDASAATV